MIFEDFFNDLKAGETIAQVRAGLIGEGAQISTPFGQKKLIYADYTASGRALRQVETFIVEKVLPFYANTHTESSFCGAYSTRLREKARSIIAAQTNAGEDCTVIFAGSGATAAINRLVALSGIAEHKDSRSGAPVVFIGPYEHHSNILPWRESGAQVIEIEEASGGGPDLEMLEEQLNAHSGRPMLVGAFTVASNVTGIVTDTDAVTGLLKRYGALAFWDCAGSAPYLQIDMNPEPELEKDAVFLSPHKFPGGPGASGILIVRNSAVKSKRPTWPGGGSVSYVSSWGHDYLHSIAEREEAGTPNIVGDIRAALVFLVKAAIGPELIAKRDRELCEMAMAVWQKNPRIKILGLPDAPRLPLFSFIVTNDDGGHIHHQLFTRMLSDIFGVQSRGGCACAGPYGHRLLSVERELSEQIRRAIQTGNELEKPGWVRLNFSYLMDDATALEIIRSVDTLADDATKYAKHYTGEVTTGQFSYLSPNAPEPRQFSVGGLT